MAWVKLDDGFFTNPKVLGVSLAGKLYHLAALTYCARELTDGLVQPAALNLIGGMAGTSAPNRLVDELVVARLWFCTEGGFQINDYLTYNPSRESVLKERAAARERMAKHGRTSGEVRANNSRTSEELHEPRTPSPLTTSSNEDSVSPLPPKEPKRITKEFIEELVTEWAPKFRGGEPKVRLRIEAALNSKSSDSWKDKRRGLRDWLRRDVEEFSYGVNSPIPFQSAPVIANGGTKNISELDDLVRPPAWELP